MSWLTSLIFKNVNNFCLFRRFALSWHDNLPKWYSLKSWESGLHAWSSHPHGIFFYILKNTDFFPKNFSLCVFSCNFRAYSWGRVLHAISTNKQAINLCSIRTIQAVLSRCKSGDCAVTDIYVISNGNDARRDFTYQLSVLLCAIKGTL